MAAVAKTKRAEHRLIEFELECKSAVNGRRRPTVANAAELAMSQKLHV